MCTKSAAVVTFGCKVNQYESQAISEQLAGKGFILSDLKDGLDGYVINTCTVTEAAFKEAFKFVKKLACKNPKSVIVVTGCATESNELNFRQIEGVLVERNKQHVTGVLTGSGESQSLKITTFDQHTRAFLKVQDGCDLNCSFCIIPDVRGGNKSKPISDVVQEARHLIENGYREIVLTGVHLGSYGKDIFSRSALSQLVSDLLRIQQLDRIRLSSIEINEVTKNLIDIMKDNERFCPQLHVPLQSGDDSVLKAMRRRYNTKQFLEKIDMIQSLVKDPSFSTDVIVGFPTETEQNFESTLKLCERVGFSRVHIFTYSPRIGTDAALLCDLPVSVKKDRYDRLQEVARKTSSEFYKRFVGRRVNILIESLDQLVHGYTERYLKANIRSKVVKGQIVSAQVDKVNEDLLICNETEK